MKPYSCVKEVANRTHTHRSCAYIMVGSVQETSPQQPATKRSAEADPEPSPVPKRTAEAPKPAQNVQHSEQLSNAVAASDQPNSVCEPLPFPSFFKSGQFMAMYVEMMDCLIVIDVAARSSYYIQAEPAMHSFRRRNCDGAACFVQIRCLVAENSFSRRYYQASAQETPAVDQSASADAKVAEDPPSRAPSVAETKEVKPAGTDVTDLAAVASKLVNEVNAVTAALQEAEKVSMLKILVYQSFRCCRDLVVPTRIFSR